jgi:hypothetical protein
MKGIQIKFIPSIQKSSEQICQKLPQNLLQISQILCRCKKWVEKLGFGETIY